MLLGDLGARSGSGDQVREADGELPIDYTSAA